MLIHGTGTNIPSRLERRKTNTHRRKSRKTKVFKFLIGIILIVFIVLAWFWNHPASLPPAKIYYHNTFNSGIEGWSSADAVWLENEGAVKLQQKNTRSPYLMYALSRDQSPAESFVWHISLRVSSFTDDAIVLGALSSTGDPFVLVVNTHGYLGIAGNMNSQPVYSSVLFGRLSFDEWENIYVHFDENTHRTTVYLNGRKVLDKSRAELGLPVTHIYLGTLWPQSKTNYGVPADVSYRYVCLGNQGLLPGSTFSEYLLNQMDTGLQWLKTKYSTLF